MIRRFHLRAPRTGAATRSARTAVWRSALALGALMLANCRSDASLLDPTEFPDGGGGVQRATLDIRVTLPDSGDARIAGVLGSPGAVLADADVVVQRTGVATQIAARTDAQGLARFTDLLPGTYSVSIARALTASETARLPLPDRDVIAFGGGAAVSLGAASATTSVAGFTARRGSLVFSEIFVYQPRAADGGYYFYGPYFEIYNNSDTTIFLDGKHFGLAVRAEFEILPNYPCSATARWRADASGLWSRYFWTFPGDGSLHPIRPGEARVIATDAIDHREFVPGLQDLRAAHFEFIGRQDVDNPLVPNMINSGPGSALGSTQTHGFNGAATAMVLFLADAVPVSSLPGAIVYEGDLASEGDHRQFPAAAVLDVFATLWTPEIAASVPNARAECPESTHPRFDRQRGRLLDINAAASIQRRVLRALPDGRALLQRTLTSERDFFRAEQISPGSVP